MQGIIEKFKPFSNMKLISLISWLFLAGTSISSFERPGASLKIAGYKIIAKVFWMTLSYSIDIPGAETNNFIIEIYYGIYYFCFTFLILLILFSCSTMVLMVLRGEEEINDMFGNISKFHFVPILCTSALFIIGETMEFNIYEKDDAPFICNLIFTFLAICTLVLIHIKTDISSSKTNFYIFKQATYGWLMALLVYNLFFGMYIYGVKIIVDQEIDNPDYNKNCSIAYSILIGIINLIIAFVVKNAVIPVANLFIYIGMTVSFFKMNEKERLNGVAEGVIDIVMIVLTLCFLVFLVFKFRSQIII